MYNLNKSKIAIVGLGYVGLPLAIEFAKKRNVLGYDINNSRINQLIKFYDLTKEITTKQLKESKKLKFTSNLKDISKCNIFIITVPTPITKNKKPDLKPILNATKLIGKILKKEDIVIYESTVFPGTTEEICVPILEKTSNLKFNKDFYCGYSPERINPGDKKHTISKIKKITSGSSPKISTIIDNLYREIIKEGTHKVKNIKIAEAAKVIENTQRDLNIALINELAIIFKNLNLDTEEILKAAETKWNFISYRPGLVGGHCIGVDPYYLTYKAEQIGYSPKIILAGRKLNDSMGNYVCNQILKEAFKKIKKIKFNILIMGLAFKENCPDFRNSQVLKMIQNLKNKRHNVDVFDPYVDQKEVKKLHNLNLRNKLTKRGYDLIIVTVGHEKFKKMGAKKIRALGNKQHILYDLKYIFSQEETDLRL